MISTDSHYLHFHSNAEQIRKGKKQNVVHIKSCYLSGTVASEQKAWLKRQLRGGGSHSNIVSQLWWECLSWKLARKGLIKSLHKYVCNRLCPTHYKWEATSFHSGSVIFLLFTSEYAIPFDEKSSGKPLKA